MSYFLGIDVGTSSVKSLLMDPQGKIIGLAQQGYDVICPHPMWAEIPVADIWNATCKTLRQLSDTYPETVKQVKAISFSGQMHSMILLDENDNPVWNAITWLDNRSIEEAKEIDRISHEKGYRSKILNAVTPNILVSFLYWLEKYKPEVICRAQHVMLVKDYIRYKICGEIGTDHSDAASTMIFDQIKHEWAWDMMDELHLRKELFPKESHNSHEIAGCVTAECARLTGLKDGTLVCYGGGDTLMNHIGNGLVYNDGRILSTIGTSSHVSSGLTFPLSDLQNRAFTYCHVLPDRWLTLIGGPNGGIVLKWLKNNILGGNYSFDEMSAIGAKAPVGSNGVRCIPYLSGSHLPLNPAAKSVYVGMGLSHGQSELVRSTMEGMVFILRKALNVLRELDVETKSIIATGGGSKDPLLLRIQADMFNLPVHINLGQEISCMGAAISAAVGSRYYHSYEEACDAIVRFSDQIIEPDPVNARIYEDIFPDFDRVYEQNIAFFR